MRWPHSQNKDKTNTPAARIISTARQRLARWWITLQVVLIELNVALGFRHGNIHVVHTCYNIAWKASYLYRCRQQVSWQGIVEPCPVVHGEHPTQSNVRYTTKKGKLYFSWNRRYVLTTHTWWDTQRDLEEDNYFTTRACLHIPGTRYYFPSVQTPFPIVLNLLPCICSFCLITPYFRRLGVLPR